MISNELKNRILSSIIIIPIAIFFLFQGSIFFAFFLSIFLLWQLAYSEIFFEKKLWPDFNEKDYKKIISNFKITKRNFGAL